MTDSLPIIFEALLERHGHIVDSVVSQTLRRFPWRVSFEKDDLVNAGLYALYRAAQRYDPEKGEFSDFARIIVRGAVIQTMIDGIMILVPRKLVKSKDRAYDHLYPAPLPLNLTEDVDPLLASLKDLIDVLSPIEKYVIVHSFGLEGESPLDDEEIGRLLSRTSIEVSKIRMLAILKMKSSFSEE